MFQQTHNSHDPASIEVLHFAIPEVNASIPMGEAATRYSQEIGADFTGIDVWTNPEAVLTHRVRFGPTIIILANGQEVARLEGPRSRRSINRFFTKSTPTVKPVLVAA